MKMWKDEESIMKKVALAVAALGFLAAPASAEIAGLNSDLSTYNPVVKLAKSKNGGKPVSVVTTEQAASTFGGFNSGGKSLDSAAWPTVQSR